jgi:hypothetical protein
VAKIESTVTIARPVEDVYQHFLDLDKTASDPGTQSAVKEPPDRRWPVRRSDLTTGRGGRRR